MEKSREMSRTESVKEGDGASFRKEALRLNLGKSPISFALSFTSNIKNNISGQT